MRPVCKARSLSLTLLYPENFEILGACSNFGSACDATLVEVSQFAYAHHFVLFYLLRTGVDA